MLPHSIRWRLPLSYAAIALLATVALSSMLISTLTVYFRRNEANYLYQNALALSSRLAPLIADAGQGETWKSQVPSFAFLLQTRVQILDVQREVIVDSGVPDPSYIDLITPAETSDDGPYILVRRQPFDAQAAPNVQPTPFIQPPIPNEPLGIGAGNEPPPPPPPPPAPFPSTNLLLGFVLGPEATRSGQRSNQTMQTPIIDTRTQQTLGYVELSEGPAYGTELIEQAAFVIMLASIIATAVAAGVGWSVSRRMTMPLVALTGATTAMAAGDLAIRANVQRHDEIGVLAQSFNAMAQRVEETVTALRRFVADAAHELNTPLTALRAHLELALDDASPTDQARFIEQARDDVDRLEQLANDLLDLSRMEAGSNMGLATSVDLAQMSRELGELYISAAEQKKVRFTTHVPQEDVLVYGNAGQTRRALTNVLENALKFTPSGGSVMLTLTVDFDNVFVEIRDTGIGIPADDLPHVFSRFHRARNTAAYPGSGLGLAIVKAIMARHGGDIRVQSDNNGTCFTFHWPRIASLTTESGQQLAKPMNLF